MHPLLHALPLGPPPWPTLDPFLFCVHHVDHYPAGNAELGPAASLVGRDLGQDFAGRDGWRMYHGERIPGFPAHPHRGFETVTLARRGVIDHSDSLGAAARFSTGDVQWMTAGAGIVHSEMFPLLNADTPNPAELFQLWLNLPGRNKLVPPHFSMFWNEQVPRVHEGAPGQSAEVTVVAGAFGDASPPAPPPHSWAADAEHEVAIWAIKLEAGARLTLPAASERAHRVLYFFAGEQLTVTGKTIAGAHALQLAPHIPTEIVAGSTPVEVLMLQGRPIGEPVSQQGPFVMNTPAEVQAAYSDFRRTGFGGWPWPSRAPVHPAAEGRFARHADGRVERGG